MFLESKQNTEKVISDKVLLRRKLIACIGLSLAVAFTVYSIVAMKCKASSLKEQRVNKFKQTIEKNIKSDKPFVGLMYYSVCALVSDKQEDCDAVIQWQQLTDVADLIREGEELAEELGIYPFYTSENVKVNENTLTKTKEWLNKQQQAYKRLGESKYKNNMYKDSFTKSMLSLNNAFTDCWDTITLYKDVSELHRHIKENITKEASWKHSNTGKLTISKYNALLNKVPSQSTKVKGTLLYLSLSEYKPFK